MKEHIVHQIQNENGESLYVKYCPSNPESQTTNTNAAISYPEPPPEIFLSPYDFDPIKISWGSGTTNCVWVEKSQWGHTGKFGALGSSAKTSGVNWEPERPPSGLNWEPERPPGGLNWAHSGTVRFPM